MAQTKTLAKGDIIQWLSPKDEKGNPSGVEVLLEVERVDSEQEKVYLNIVEQTFTDLSKQVMTRKTTGSREMSVEDALGRKRRHEAINKPKDDRRRYTEPEEMFSFGIDDEQSAEAAAKHWGYVRAVRIKVLTEELKLSKKTKDDTGIVNALTELVKYQRLTPQNRRLLMSAMQREELARISSR